VLGKGNRCTVIMGTNKLSKQGVAIKRLEKEQVSKEVLEQTNQEIHILRMSVHHYCCRILDLFSDAKYLYFVMEIEGGSTLQNYCQDRNCNLKEDHVRSIAVKIA
jgi:serine/threonine protein kinase